MIRIALTLSVLFAPSSLAQTEDWPPPPGPICGEIESDIEPYHRFHELQLTAENYRRDMDAMNGHVRQWIEQNGEAGREVFSWEVQMAWHNNMTAIHLYTLRLEAMSASPGEQEAAIAVFCNALAEAVIWD
jgi:hypothetical protein